MKFKFKLRERCFQPKSTLLFYFLGRMSKDELFYIKIHTNLRTKEIFITYMNPKNIIDFGLSNHFLFSTNFALFPKSLVFAWLSQLRRRQRLFVSLPKLSSPRPYFQVLYVICTALQDTLYHSRNETLHAPAVKFFMLSVPCLVA